MGEDKSGYLAGLGGSHQNCAFAGHLSGLKGPWLGPMLNLPRRMKIFTTTPTFEVTDALSAEPFKTCYEWQIVSCAIQHLDHANLMMLYGEQ